jgi:hypothetical protein
MPDVPPKTRIWVFARRSWWAILIVVLSTLGEKYEAELKTCKKMLLVVRDADEGILDDSYGLYLYLFVSPDLNARFLIFVRISVDCPLMPALLPLPGGH